MVGTWIALLAVPADNYIGYMFAAFILFRFFDILKPLGIKQAEKLPSGYGIMADSCAREKFIHIYLQKGRAIYVHQSAALCTDCYFC